MFPVSPVPQPGPLLSPIVLPVSPFQPLTMKRGIGRSFISDTLNEKENDISSNALMGGFPHILRVNGRGLTSDSGSGFERVPLRTKKPNIPVERMPLTPSQRKIQKLEEKVRRLESKLHRAERQHAVHAERLVELASENKNMRQELQDALEEGEELTARAKELEQERDLYHAWWVNEAKLSQSLMDNGYQYTPGAPSWSGDGHEEAIPNITL
jgi:uncharacterized protein YdeI (YjbR/CyaY-like superfamily)